MVGFASDVIRVLKSLSVVEIARAFDKCHIVTFPARQVRHTHNTRSTSGLDLTHSSTFGKNY